MFLFSWFCYASHTVIPNVFVLEQQSVTFKKASRIKKLVMQIVPVRAACSRSETAHVPFLSVWLTSGYQ